MAGLPCALRSAIALTVATVCAAGVSAQSRQSSVDATTAYRSIREFALDGGSVQVQNLKLKRDRAEMSFSGVFYFTHPVMGKVTGAVFVGQGNFRAEPPPSVFERDHVRRMLKAEVVESDFRTAVLRFTDNTFEEIGGQASPGASAEGEPAKIVEDFKEHFTKGTGMNLESRLLLSMLNHEAPGFFLAHFHGGKRNRFTFVLDYQGRVLSNAFTINGGEKGFIFGHEDTQRFPEDWMAFYSLADYQRGTVEYSDQYDLIDAPRYKMSIDVRDPVGRLALTAEIECESKMDGIEAVPFVVSENLTSYDESLLKKFMRVKAARLADGTPLTSIQEDWEHGFTVLLPKQVARGDKFTLVLELEGKFLFEPDRLPTIFYPLGTAQWYPRHGYLKRSTFDLVFRHRKGDLVTSVGVRTREEPAGNNKNEMITEWVMSKPVSFITFSVGRFERHVDSVENLPVEFYSLSGAVMAIKEDFILAELKNSLRYFSALYGDYEYPKFGATFHPRSFGQGFATMLMIPNTDRASRYTYSFIAHEAAHQWWGNTVSWRSYRDQWLSEGFAEYSGILYTSRRDSPKGAMDLLDDLRRLVRQPTVYKLRGSEHSRLTDIGPIVLGHRLSSKVTPEGYTALIYYKGALVLRMLHFLLSNPATGNGQPFFDMMKDFVESHRDGTASTEDFAQLAGEHFAKSPIAQKYGMQDLNWFFRQWVWQSALPSYRLEYSLENQPDGKTLVKGTIFQENAPEDWVMPLPLLLKFSGGKTARGTVLAKGPQQPVNISLPMRPEAVELDPDFWVLSEKTSTKKQ